MRAGDSSLRHSKEVEQLKEDNHQLDVKVKKLEAANKELSEAVEHFDEEKGDLQCQIDDLTTRLQNSAR